MNDNRFLTKASDGNTMFITATSNVHVASWVLFLVTPPFLNLFMIHWIHWVQWKWFRKNSIVFFSEVFNIGSDHTKSSKTIYIFTYAAGAVGEKFPDSTFLHLTEPLFWPHALVEVMNKPVSNKLNKTSSIKI